MSKCQFTKWIVPQGCGIHYRELFECNREAIVFKDGKHLCRKHAKLGRFIIRNGDVGAILFRCDNEADLRQEFAKDKYRVETYRMQKITSSHRKTIY